MKRFTRPVNTTKVSNLYIILPEGTRTEQEYYYKQADRMFNENGNNETGYGLKLLKPGASNHPAGLINGMNKHLRMEKYRENDEAWLVFDRDEWSAAEFNAVENWEKKDPRHHYALSHPCFEYWLLLHFEDVSGNLTAPDVMHRLKNHLPDYNKNIPRGFVTIDKVKRACKAARIKYSQCSDLRNDNGSTVYQLIERLAKEAGVDLS